MTWLELVLALFRRHVELPRVLVEARERDKAVHRKSREALRAAYKAMDARLKASK